MGVFSVANSTSGVFIITPFVKSRSQEAAEEKGLSA